MKELYKNLTFRHLNSDTNAVIDSAYAGALAVIMADGGIPISATSFKQSGVVAVTIIYKSQKFN